MSLRIRPAYQPAIVFVVMLTGIALLLSACSWSVPADPGLNAKLHAKPSSSAGAIPPGTVPGATVASSPASDDAIARGLYLNHCSRCHEPIPPEALAAGDWPRYVRRYGPRAGLFGAERARVLRWLQANTR